jgi:hypothetical protein
MKGQEIMVVKLVEIFRQNRLSEGKLATKKYVLREIFINPEHIVCLREEETYKTMLEEGLFEDMDIRQSFTKIYLNRGQMGIDLVVIGSPDTIQEKLGLNKQQLLKG